MGKIILIAILLYSSVCFAQYGERLVTNIPQTPCDILYDEIENAFKEANFCQEDNDCKTIELGGEHIDFGCYKFVNHTIDENKLFEKLRLYHQQCAEEIDECAPSPKPQCINKRCVHVKAGSPNTECTLEAKLCPDGSYVGRIPPDCHFAKCP